MSARLAIAIAMPIQPDIVVDKNNGCRCLNFHRQGSKPSRRIARARAYPSYSTQRADYYTIFYECSFGWIKASLKRLPVHLFPTAHTALNQRLQRSRHPLRQRFLSGNPI